MASIRIKNEMSGIRYFSKTKFNREKKNCKTLTNCKFKKKILSCTISHMSGVGNKLHKTKITSLAYFPLETTHTNAFNICAALPLMGWGLPASKHVG